MKKIIEGVIHKNGVELENHPLGYSSKVYTLSEVASRLGMSVRVQSMSKSSSHLEFDEFVGHKVRVTIEKVTPNKPKDIKIGLNLFIIDLLEYHKSDDSSEFMKLVSDLDSSNFGLNKNDLKIFRSLISDLLFILNSDYSLDSIEFKSSISEVYRFIHKLK